MAVVTIESKTKKLYSDSMGIAIDQSTKLQQLKQKCIEFGKTVEQEMKMRQELKLENQLLQGKLKELQEQQFLLIKEKQEWNQKCEEVKTEFSDVSEHLAQISYLLGYQVTQLDVTEPNVQVATFQYNEECFVQFAKGEHYDLKRIHPEHPNFDAIKMMLRETNDISGLLANLRMYFNEISRKSKEIKV